jgi:hypothetical protein
MRSGRTPGRLLPLVGLTGVGSGRLDEDGLLSTLADAEPSPFRSLALEAAAASNTASSQTSQSSSLLWFCGVLDDITIASEILRSNSCSEYAGGGGRLSMAVIEVGKLSRNQSDKVSSFILATPSPGLTYSGPHSWRGV